MPEKQKQAMNLAIKNGYYNYPRKTNLDNLAKIAKVSKQTFQENLRKAENKLIPSLI
jgi:predicted DNA binding protein